MLTKVPESTGDDAVAITPDTPTEQQASKASPPEGKGTPHSSPHHPAYPPPHQPKHQDTEHPTQQPKRYEDILAYEDKWIGWDGPVWCSRYGRFENQEDAAADDGYKSVGQVHHQDLGLQRCEKHGCACRVPFEHRSYVKDIQRRVEPMVESLIRLECQVGKLIHHAMKDGESMLHHQHHNGHVENGVGSKQQQQHEASKSPPDAGQEPEPSESLLDAAYRLNYNEHPHSGPRHENCLGSKEHETSKSSPPDASSKPEPNESVLDAAYRLRYDEVPHKGHRQRPRELPATSLDKLAHRVENLMEQVQHLMKKSEERFEKVGENLVPPPREGKGEVADESHNDGREYYQGGR